MSSFKAYSINFVIFNKKNLQSNTIFIIFIRSYNMEEIKQEFIPLPDDETDLIGGEGIRSGSAPADPGLRPASDTASELIAAVQLWRNGRILHRIRGRCRRSAQNAVSLV